jgi:TPR repeat protein
VLPFSFSHDYIGGPEVGWCEPKTLRNGRSAPPTVIGPGKWRWLRQRPGQVSAQLANELTVQTAMAVSGAAFASASGRARAPANVILALTNARLGTWLPTPDRHQREPKPDQWWKAVAPRRRRMSYLLREIFAAYPRDFPMLFVSDGGYYENLGLVELLRHRCHEIYCFDASSDTEAFAKSLGQAITLAYDELGVRIVLDEPDKAQPAGTSTTTSSDDEDTHPAVDGLADRFAGTPIITGRIQYEYPMDGPASRQREGVIVIGRAVLTKDVPWEIQRHAAAHPLFPQDAIGDQWFDDKKFNAYTGLGRHVGKLAVAAMQRQCRLLRGQQAADIADDSPDWWKPAAAGHATAAYRLGLLLEAKERDQARMWLSRAAGKGHVEAMYELGALLAKDGSTEARRWYERAAANGHTEAMYRLGDLLAKDGSTEARRWYERAAANGHTEAMYRLGGLLASDWQLAERWYECAAAAGHAGAMNDLAVALLLPRLAKESDEENAKEVLTRATSLLQAAQRAGGATAKHNMDLLLEASPDWSRGLAAAKADMAKAVADMVRWE